MTDNDLNRLREAKERQDKAIKLVVLEMAYLSGLIATNPLNNALDEQVEQVLPPAPREIWN